MNRILTTVLSIHWTVVFALLAWSDGSALSGSRIEGQSPLLSIAVSAGLALVAALFLWLLLSAWLERDPNGGETGEVARIAFAGAALAMTLMIAPAAHESPGPLLTGIALQLTALLCSYLAIAAEIRGPSVRSESERAGALATRIKALDAARETVLGRQARAPAGEAN